MCISIDGYVTTPDERPDDRTRRRRVQVLDRSVEERPRQHYAYSSPDLIALAALYTAGLVRNHPFIDGNKRTGFAIGIVFLELNGSDFKAREEDATQAVLALAAGTLDEAEYTTWLRANIKRRGR